MSKTVSTANSTELHLMLKPTGEAITLSIADQEQLVRALLSPPEPAPALQRAFVHRRKLLGVE